MTALRIVSSIDLPTKGLPEGKTAAQALAKAVEMRDALWATKIPEDAKLNQLEDYCRKLYGGDKLAGQLLSSLAIWS